MKRIMCLLLAIMMMMATLAFASAEEVKITFYTENATNGANEARLAAFNALYPNIKVELVEMPAGSTDRMQMLSTVLQAKDSSLDVFIVDCTWPERSEERR